MEKPLDYEKLNKVRPDQKVTDWLNGKLTPSQKEVQGMVTREMGSFVDNLCEKYGIAIDFKVMLLFPKEWGQDVHGEKHGKN